MICTFFLLVLFLIFLVKRKYLFKYFLKFRESYVRIGDLYVSQVPTHVSLLMLIERTQPGIGFSGEVVLMKLTRDTWGPKAELI